MRFSLRTLLILLAIAPPLVAVGYRYFIPEVVVVYLVPAVLPPDPSWRARQWPATASNGSLTFGASGASRGLPCFSGEVRFPTIGSMTYREIDEAFMDGQRPLDWDEVLSLLPNTTEDEVSAWAEERAAKVRAEWVAE